MKLSTIWSLPGLPLSERLKRTRDSLALSAAAALPKRVRFWATVLNINHATIKINSVVGATTVDQIMKNMDLPKDMVR